MATIFTILVRGEFLLRPKVTEALHNVSNCCLHSQKRWLSQHISIVSQEPTLFGRSIKRNIIYGLEGTDMEPSQEEIERVARLANAHDFIEVRRL
jgi:ABC-type transport system involved in cytochrome bd biosynthesis fused ATPase/permease subunit